MDSKKDISQLEWALKIYSDVVKFGKKSVMAEDGILCIKVLEEFEEYEKCSDLFRVLNQNFPGILEGMDINKKK
jgi:hypothetical protein